jgi:iron complex outermembrane recepter protein
MLGDQPWGPPDTYDTFNTGARLDYTFSPSWLAFAAASFSHSLIQDNVIYAYGCYYEAECNTGSAPYTHWFFAPDGTYDIYDYRDPGELRIDAEAEAMLTGHIHTGAVTQDITVGGELFLRSVQQPGFYTAAESLFAQTALCRTARSTPTSARRTSTSPSRPSRQDPNSLNIHSIRRPAPPVGRQPSISGVIQDRIHLPGRIQLIAGGRYDSLRDHNYSLCIRPGFFP